LRNDPAFFPNKKMDKLKADDKILTFFFLIFSCEFSSFAIDPEINFFDVSIRTQIHTS